MRSLVGEQLVSADEKKVEGTITGQLQESGRWFAVVDDDYEICLDGCDHILDLFGVARESKPWLKASYVRLAPNV